MRQSDLALVMATEEWLLAASCSEPRFRLGKKDRVGRHSSTSGDRVIGRGYPIAGTAEIGHITAVTQHRQV